jgi:hypothetical protein
MPFDRKAALKSGIGSFKKLCFFVKFIDFYFKTISSFPAWVQFLKINKKANFLFFLSG